MSKLLSNTIITRFFNSYTSKGLILIALQMESIGILPNGFSSFIGDMAAKEIATWLIIIIGLYFIIHKPKKSSKKLDILKENLEMLQLLLETLEIIKKIRDLKSK